MNIFEKIHELANKGFLCELVTDAWANWKFNDNGRPDHNTATPLYLRLNEFDYIHEVCYRGCYWYFNKSGKLIQDDIGCFSIERGGAQKAFNKLLEEYESIKDEIDENGFKNTI